MYSTAEILRETILVGCYAVASPFDLSDDTGRVEVILVPKGNVEETHMPDTDTGQTNISEAAMDTAGEKAEGVVGEKAD